MSDGITTIGALRSLLRSFMVAWLLFGIGCGADGIDQMKPPPTMWMPDPDPNRPQQFVAFGDFGVDSVDELNVSRLVKAMNPDFIVALGDNNYLKGNEYDRAIGKYYADFIGQYQGMYGSGSTTNRFWPALGNHDWDAMPIDSHYAYFPSLPGNKRYYDMRVGRVHIFFVDSDPREPDGVAVDSVQAMWLKSALAASSACHKLVAFHHPPYGSSGFDVIWMRWPFKEWGADAVLSGHQHSWERMRVDRIPYLIAGLGGALNRFGILSKTPYTEMYYNDDFGALKATVDSMGIRYEFFSQKGELVDSLSVAKACP